MTPTRPSRMNSIETAGSPWRAMTSPSRTSSRRQYPTSRSASFALPKASENQASSERAASRSARCASITSCSHASSARSRSERDDDAVAGDEARGAERAFELRRQADQDDAGAAFGGGAGDLPEAVGRRGVDPGHAAEIEDQKPAFRPFGKQRLDVLVEPVGGAEEQIALQRHALDFAAVRGEERQFVGTAVERRAQFRTVEAELDRVHPAGAQGEGGATDDHADQNAGDESPIDDQRGDGEERQIIDQQQLPRRSDQPLLDQAGAEEQQARRRARISARRRESPGRSAARRRRSPRWSGR